MPVVYLKLLSGEEIIAEMIENSPEKIRLSDPLSMESSIDDSDPSRRFVYLSRFSPYSADQLVEIRQNAIAMIHPVTRLVEDYYTVSLDYCRKYGDVKFDAGISETTSAMKGIVSSAEKAASRVIGAVLEDVVERFSASYFAPGSNTAH